MNLEVARNELQIHSDINTFIMYGNLLRPHNPTLKVDPKDYITTKTKK